jgi:uncharacterized membrane protein YqjE
VALWSRYGWITLAVLLASYVLGAWWVFRKVMAEISAAPPVLAETLRELSNDRNALFADARREDDGVGGAS